MCQLNICNTATFYTSFEGNVSHTEYWMVNMKYKIIYYKILFTLVHNFNLTDHTTHHISYRRPAITTAAARADMAERTTSYLIPLLLTSAAPMLGWRTTSYHAHKDFLP